MFFETIGLELQMFFRIMLACVLGAVVGLERESGERPAGFRTHTLVCMGSCLFMIVSVYGFDDMGTVRDPARLAAQVVSGIGFLGAGTILHQGANVKGLTTAASIWMVAAIGLATGVGLYLVAVFSTLLMLATLIVFARWGKAVNFSKHSERFSVRIGAQDKPGNVEKILSHLNMEGVKIKGVNVMRDMTNETVILEAQMLVSTDKIDYFNDILMDIKNLNYVSTVENSGQIK